MLPGLPLSVLHLIHDGVSLLLPEVQILRRKEFIKDLRERDRAASENGNVLMRSKLF